MLGSDITRAVLAIPIALATFAVGPLCAQQDPDGQYEPGRAVARLSVVNGDVSVRRGDSGEVVAGAANAPVMADDRVLTSSAARAEIELDSANVIRVAPSSEVRFAAMDIRSFQIQVAAGTVLFRTLRPSQSQIEVDTPSVAVRPLQPGAYRVTVHEDGSSQITVRIGEAEIDSQRGGERLQAGQTMNARGPAVDPEYQVVQGIPRDAFDRWNDERDRYILASQSYQHVNPGVTGAEDLDQNGRWINDPNYGAVWQPTAVGPDWAPYQNGQWTWEDYYGWTWVSYDPWGWAPYHYGRWFWGPGGWCWYPGPIGVYPYWAPAYVGFFGFGGGFGLSFGFGFGGIGWVALAPFEIFHPWWGRGFYGGFGGGLFAGHTTIVNNFNVYNAYRNARVTGGAVGMSAAAFGRAGQITAVNRAQLQSAGAVHGVVPIAPDRSSLRFSNHAVSGRFPQSRVQNFASRMQAPRVQHTSFEQQQRGMQQLARTNFSQSASRGFGGAARESAAHGWSRFGEPIHGTTGGYNAGPGGAGREVSPFSRGYSSQAGAVRISPPIVQRGYSERGYSEPRSAPATRSVPSYSGGGERSSASSAPRAARSSSGGGNRSGGGGHRR